MRTARLTIFEGPDGSGKTTLAKQWASHTGALYVHSGPFTGLLGIGRFYAEAMLPALLGHKDVVMDRCWISELPYGQAFRNGQDRLGDQRRRALERLAARCQTKVIVCLPAYEVCEANYKSRRQTEMLENLDQLKQVYDWYRTMDVGLPQTFYNFAHDTIAGINMLRETTPHLVSSRSAGYLRARVAIVGENFGHHKETDSLYQWPFGSMSAQGCSHWLTAQLGSHVAENELFWVNADQPNLELLLENKIVFALGREANTELERLGIRHRAQVHPQHWKRFHHNTPYPLTYEISQALANVPQGILL